MFTVDVTLLLRQLMLIRDLTVQVKHLVLVETDHARASRLLVEAELKAPRPPLVVQHSTLR